MILEKLGWNPERAAVFMSSANRGFVPARVARQDRAGYVVWSNDGLHPAQLSGRLRYKLADEVNLVSVGDWVAIDQQGGTTTIQEVLPRTSTCVRKSAGAVTSAQIIATNVDWLLLVSGLDGDFNPLHQHVRSKERRCGHVCANRGYQRRLAVAGQRT